MSRRQAIVFSGFDDSNCKVQWAVYHPLPKGGLEIADYSSPGSQGLQLLFKRGARPDRRALREFASSQAGVAISHDPQGDMPVHLASSDGQSVAEEGGTLANIRADLAWAELLSEGMTFDLSGLAPGKPVAFPTFDYMFDFAARPEASDYEVLHLAPGHHLAGGERAVPVAKAMLSVARDMVEHFDDLEGVVWPASSSAIGHQFFESVITAWFEGGPFPALGLTAFRETTDGALQTEGLSFWIDQELRIEPPLSNDKVSATRIGVRLVNQLVLVGGVETSERVVAPDGTRLVLRTSRNGKFVRVWRE